MADTLIREGNPPAGAPASPTPQYWNPNADGGAGAYEKVEGREGASKTMSEDGHHVSLGATFDPEATGNGSVIGILKRIRTLLGNLDTKDYATQTTLTGIKELLDTLTSKNFATETTLSNVEAIAESIASTVVEKATEATLAQVKSELEAIKARLDGNFTGTVEVSNLPSTQAVEGEVAVVNFPEVQEVEGIVDVGNLPEVQEVTGEVEVTNLPEVQKVEADQPLPVSLYGNIATRLAGNSAEVVSVQHAELAGTTVTYSLADGASKIELYLESGYIRIRTDGQPATATTGEPLGEGFGACWAVDSISVYCVEDSVFTVVSRV